MPTVQARHARHGAPLLLALLPCLCGSALAAVRSAGGPERGVAVVASPPQFVQALSNPSVSSIVVSGVYKAKAELQPFTDAGRHLLLNRNITIRGAAGRDSVLDFDFCGAAIKLGRGVWLTFKNVTLANERRGNNPSFDVLAAGQGGAEGSAVQLLDVYRWRLACTDAATFGRTMDKTPRSLLFPNSSDGTQQHRTVTLSFKGSTYKDQIMPIDYALDIPITFEEGRENSGGYGLWARNVVRVCRSEASAECLRTKSADACVIELMDAVAAGGGSGSDAQPGGQPSPAVLGAAVAVPLAVAAVGALALGVWLVRRRQRRTHCASLAEGALAQAGGPSGVSKGGEGPPSALAGASAATTADSTIASSLQRHDSYSQRNWPQAVLDKRWQVMNSCTTPLVGHEGKDTDVHFGEFLGAGSYGRVFRGRWCGLDVAIKVFDHAPTTVQAVEREAKLLLQLPPHRNLLRAYHLVTFGRSPRRAADRSGPVDSANTTATATTASSGSSGVPLPADDSANMLHTPSKALAPPTPPAASPAASTLLPRTPRPGSGATGTSPSLTPAATPSMHQPVLDVCPPVTAQSDAASSASRCRHAETFLVTELCDGGTLHEVASAWAPEAECDTNMLQRLLLLRDAATGLAALHAASVVHGDLNARNVLTSRSSDVEPGGLPLVAKIADLGLSRMMKTHATHHSTATVGTMSHMAPELLQFGRLSPACDVYAFGIMMFEVFARKFAFDRLHVGAFFQVVVVQSLRPKLPPGMPADYQLLMEQCWCAAPELRPCAKRIVTCLDSMIRLRRQRIAEHTAAGAPPLPASTPEGLARDLQWQQQQHAAREGPRSAPDNGVPGLPWRPCQPGQQGEPEALTAQPSLPPEPQTDVSWAV